MALRKGEVYRCSDAECGCEITATKGAAPCMGGDTTLLLRQSEGQERLIFRAE